MGKELSEKCHTFVAFSPRHLSGAQPHTFHKFTQLSISQHRIFQFNGIKKTEPVRVTTESLTPSWIYSCRIASSVTRP